MCNWMIFRAVHRAANLNMFTILYLNLISDLEGLEAHSFSWQLRLKELVGCQRTSAMCCARLRCRSRQPAVGWLAAERRTSTHTSDLVASLSLHLFVLPAVLLPPTWSHLFSVSVSLIVTYSLQTTWTKDKKRGRPRGNVPSKRPISTLYGSGGGFQLREPIIVPKIAYLDRSFMLKQDYWMVLYLE